VIGIIAISAYKLTKKSVGNDKLLWFIYLVLVAVTVITESEVAWLFLAAGVRSGSGAPAESGCAKAR
jgi:chromate transporter